MTIQTKAKISDETIKSAIEAISTALGKALVSQELNYEDMILVLQLFCHTSQEHRKKFAEAISILADEYHMMFGPPAGPPIFKT